MIKSIVKSYAVYESMEDLLQELYFGLVKAVDYYEITENCRLIFCAQYRIRQFVIRYLQKCGSVVRYMSHTHQNMTRYRKTFKRFEQGAW